MTVQIEVSPVAFGDNCDVVPVQVIEGIEVFAGPPVPIVSVPVAAIIGIKIVITVRMIILGIK